MNYYGVGVKFGGTIDMWDVFSENQCWFMGYLETQKPKFDDLIRSVNEGDILIAKAYGTATQSKFYIRAIGLVYKTKKPDTVTDEYRDNLGLSVIWIKHFETPIALIASEYERGGVHTNTIYKEENQKLIEKIHELMHY